MQFKVFFTGDRNVHDALSPISVTWSQVRGILGHLLSLQLTGESFGLQRQNEYVTEREREPLK